MDAANDQVTQSLPLDVVAHNATVILSGVVLGALLAFAVSYLGWLRHYVHLNDRLVDAIFPLGLQLCFFTLPLWLILTLPHALRLSAFIREYVPTIYQYGLPEYAIETNTPQVTEKP